MATWTEDIVTALERLGGTGSYSQIYAGLAEIRTEPLPAAWKKIVQRRVQDLSSDSAGFKDGDDLFFAVEGLGQGVWGLRAAVVSTPRAVDLSPGEENPGRVSQTTYRILRDTKLARQIKLLHRNKCQLCGLALSQGGGLTYSEAHHIIPLGKKHRGPDVAANILVLCPNHHAQCDMGAIRLDLAQIHVVPGHAVAAESISYHNQQIYAQPITDD